MPVAAAAVRDLIDRSSDCFLLIDRQGRVRHANGAAIACFGGGVSPVGSALSSWIVPAPHDSILSTPAPSLSESPVSIPSVSAGSNPDRSDSPDSRDLIHIEGNFPRILHVRLSSGEVVEGTLTRWAAETSHPDSFAFILMVSARAAAEAAAETAVMGSGPGRPREILHLSERKYRSLIEHSPDVVRIIDGEGRVTFISPNAGQVYGYTDREIREGSPAIWIGIIHPDDMGEVIRAFQELFQQRKPYAIEYRVIRKDRNVVWILDRANTPYEVDGVLYSDGVCTDITPQKEAAANLQLFRTLVNQSDDAFMVVSAPTGRFVDVNDVGYGRLGYTRDEFLRLSVCDVEVLLPTADAWGRFYQEIRSRVNVILEGEHRRKDGSTFPVELNVKLIVIDKEEFIVSVARDITERKRAEEALRRAHDILARRVDEQATEVMELMRRMEDTRTSQRRFVAGASHDLRTPLTIMRAEVDLLRRSAAHDPRTRESLDRIHAESKRLDHLASDLLLLATLDSLLAEPAALREVHLQELIIDAVEEVSAAAARKNIVCNIEIDDLPSVRCDPDMVRRALLNLLRNSIDFSPEGGTVVVTLARADDRAVIEVADRGCGIAAADLPKVFDRFYRSDEARSDGGTGLGLAVVKSVVEAHHGEVGIESTPGAGTTVRMLLPIQGA